MQFHDYVTLRNQWAKQTHDIPLKETATSMDAETFRKLILNTTPIKLKTDRPDAWRRTQMVRQIEFAYVEQCWVDLDRPYYNVWPIAIELAKTVRLDLPFSAVALPFSTLLLRFAVGHELHSVGTATLHWDKDTCSVELMCWFANSSDGIKIAFNRYAPSDSVETWLNDAKQNQMGAVDWNNKERQSSFDFTSATDIMVRLAVFTGLLSHNDLITPVILAKDRDKYDTTDDESIRKWLEDRAVRRGSGRGFEIGRNLQLEKDKSPHWRNPHLCLFWTGEGRKTPVIKLRSGAVIQRVGMADVPTGYLGEETESELELTDPKTPRESFSKARRFAILKRDSYRCQLCGRSQSDNVILHVDHRIPLAKGGSNEDDNLWTLCEPCNLGKSDKDLS